MSLVIRFMFFALFILSYCVLGFIFAISPISTDELLLSAALILGFVLSVYGAFDFLFSRRVEE